MKAISLWQPWASAIAVGLKRIETRGWSTNYRGPLAIHAAKRWTRDQDAFMGTLPSAARIAILERRPLGAIVATCILIGTRFTQDVQSQLDETELAFGDYTAGRFAWFLTDIVALPTPIPYKGKQGFFDVPDELLRGAS